MSKVKRVPQGVDSWELEEWVVAECRIEPGEIQTRPDWLEQDWSRLAIGLKDEARRYRAAGQLARAVACEADAKAADERAEWMARRKSSG